MMERKAELTVAHVLSAAGGSLLRGGENTLCAGVSIDSRSIGKDELFFAVEGERFDGHDFVATLPERGARGAVVRRGWESAALLSALPHDFCIIAVDDTFTALGDTAQGWRKKLPIPLAAISGSCGKSTTKEMTASILEVGRKVLKTEGNRNNLLGLPLTLLGLRSEHQVGVVELGISERGEMTRLAEIACPDVALLTNIGIAHIASLGGFQEIVAAKGELFKSLKPEATEVINFDDLWIVEITAKSKRRQVVYSVEEKADIYLKGFEVTGPDRNVMTARFSVFDAEVACDINGVGSYLLSNAAAALAVAAALDVGRDEMAEGLSHFAPMKNRMEPLRVEGITLLDDTYNANPDSMEAALKTLSEMPGRSIAVLGDMLALGDMARNMHRRVGEVVSRLGIAKVILYGEFREDVREGAVEGGMDVESAYIVESKDDAVEILREIVSEGDVVLVKGSRGMKMEEVVERFRESYSRAG